MWRRRGSRGLLALDQIMKRELAEVLIGYKEFKGELLIDGKRLTTDELRGVRWRRIAYIPTRSLQSVRSSV